MAGKGLARAGARPIKQETFIWLRGGECCRRAFGINHESVEKRAWPHRWLRRPSEPQCRAFGQALLHNVYQYARVESVIRGFRDKKTELLFAGANVKEYSGFRKIAERKLTMLDSASALKDLLAPSRKSTGETQRESCRAIQHSDQRSMANLFRVGRRWTSRSRNHRLPLKRNHHDEEWNASHPPGRNSPGGIYESGRACQCARESP